ncbi:MAG: DUF4199 domain-containing protein [Pseudomonadota bacterium]
MKEIKWGVIFSLALLGWMLLERATGLHAENIKYHTIFSNFFAVIAVIIYVFALRDKRASLPEQKMTWLQGFISGFKIAIVVAILSPLVQLLTHHVISPDFFQNMREYSIASEMMSETRAEKYFNLNAYMFQAVAGAIGMGAITSAVVAFFLRRK